MRTVYVDVGPLAHLSGDGPVAGDVSADVSDYVNPTGSGIVVIDGMIERIATSEELLDEYGMPTTETSIGKEYKVVSLNGNAVIPGFVDGHTHLLWAGDRSRELSWRHEGKTYRQISELGGGIEDLLLPFVMGRALRRRRAGTRARLDALRVLLERVLCGGAEAAERAQRVRLLESPRQRQRRGRDYQACHFDRCEAARACQRHFGRRFRSVEAREPRTSQRAWHPGEAVVA